MKRSRIFLLPMFALFWTGNGCSDGPTSIPLPTKICVRTLHHTWPIRNATVYVKYNTDSFPGYDRPPSYFDAQFNTGTSARGCLEPVPTGRHWLVALGYDSLQLNDVFGSIQLEIALGSREVIDTILYISE